MSDRAVDPAYLRYQYDDSVKLRVRIETHQRFSERADDWLEWVLEHVAARPGYRVLDVGCGPGLYLAALATRGVDAVGLDFSFGMVAEALERTPQAPVVRADAQALPVRSATFDRVMANHMLYHVPDPGAALREMRRVLRPGGRVVMSTVARDQNRRLLELHEQAAREIGLTPTTGPGSRFNLDHIELVRDVFPTAERHVRSDAFVFRTVEPALRYYASGFVDSVAERRDDGSHRPALLERVAARISAVIAAEGVLRVPKDAGCFVADV